MLTPMTLTRVTLALSLTATLAAALAATPTEKGGNL